MANASLNAVLPYLQHAVPPPDDPRDDRELLDAFAVGHDHAAFAVLVRRHGPMVLGVCRRVLHHEQDAEDAFQAAFLVLAARAPSLRLRTTLAGFLHGIAYYLGLKARRQALRRRRREARARVPAVVDAAAELNWREVQTVLEEEIQRLPEQYRTPFVLCCLEGLSRAEAGRQLGLKEGTVWSRLSAARARLQARLAHRGIALAAVLGALAVTQKTVRAGLVEAAVEGARQGAAGSLAGAVPARVALLTRAGSQTLTGKIKLALIGLAVLLIAGAGGAILQALTAKVEAAGPAVQAQPPKRVEAEQARTDRSGDPLPAGAMVRLGTVRFRHGFGVRSVAFSPDGKQVAAGGQGRTLSLWDVATGKEVRSFRNLYMSAHVAFSPDGKVLASAGWNAGVVVLWDASTGKALRTLREQSSVFCVAFSPDGKRLSSGSFLGKVHLWDPATGEELRRLDGQVGKDRAVAFTPDSKSLVFAGKDGKIRFWDVRTGNVSRRLEEGHATGAHSLSFSLDGTLLASVGEDGRIRLWVTATGKFRAIGEELKGVAQVAFAPDGRTLASAQGDGTLALSDPATGRLVRRWPAHASGAGAVAFSSNGKVLASAGGWESDIRLWDPATGKELHASDAPHGPVEILRWSPDGQTLLAAGGDPRILWWNLRTGRPRRSLTLPAPIFTALALAPDGKTLAEGSLADHVIRLWDVPSGKPARLLGKNQISTRAIAFSPDGRLLATGGLAGETRLWDVASGKELRRFGDPGHGVECLTFSPDGRTLAYSRVPFGKPTDGPRIRLVDVASAKEVRSFSGPGWVGTLVYSPDGKVLASWENDRDHRLVRLWDVATGKEVCQHASQARGSGVIAFSPDGKLVASAPGPLGTPNDSSVHLWEAATGSLLRRFEGHYSGVASLAFSPDGLKLASGGGDATILVWDITGRRADGRWHAQPLTPRQLDACWTALANEDAVRAYDAVWTLAAAPEQAVPFLAKHLSPQPRPDAQRVARLLANLDSEKFKVRQKASEELAKLGRAVTSDLRKALAKGAKLEARRRLQQLLDRLQTPDWTPERLRDHRAIQVLEHVGTRQAQEVLQAIAGGAAGTHRTEEARAVLKRGREPRPPGARGDAK